MAVLAFAALCGAVLTRAIQLLEPDDYPYRASIIALTQGHLLSLTNTEYQALLKSLSNGAGMGIAQWVHTASGTWISEKNPGYPFLAAPFQALGMLRLAPCSTGPWAVSACSPAPAAGSAAGVAPGRSFCSVAPEQRWPSPDGPRCPRSPTPH